MYIDSSSEGGIMPAMATGMHTQFSRTYQISQFAASAFVHNTLTGMLLLHWIAVQVECLHMQSNMLSSKEKGLPVGVTPRQEPALAKAA